MIARVRTIPRTLFNVYNNWYDAKGRELALCVRECEYNTNCKGILWSPVLKQCIVTVALETTDESSLFDAYVAEKWVAVAKRDVIVGYRSGLCVFFDSGVSNCAQEPQCQWQLEPRGVNQFTFEQGDGWCGRLKCVR